MAGSGRRKYVRVGSGPASCDVQDVQVSRAVQGCTNVAERRDARERPGHGLINHTRNSFDYFLDSGLLRGKEYGAGFSFLQKINPALLILDAVD